MQPLRKLLRYGKSLVLLNRTRAQTISANAQVDHANASIRDLFSVIHRLTTNVQELESELRQYREELDSNMRQGREELEAELRQFRKETADNILAQSEETRGLSRAQAAQSAALSAQSEIGAMRERIVNQKVAGIAAATDLLSRQYAVGPRVEDQQPGADVSLLMDTFYVALEARFRGDVRDIGQRQTIYLPDIQDALRDAHAHTILDVGCGRGEWLALLRSHNIEGIGVDTNEGQLAVAREDGLAVVNDDALRFLRAQPEGRFAAVTAFHIFEHIPFPLLAEWLMEIRRVLAPGGILIAETPNPENLIVGANTFHLDPTHVRPLPSGVLEILCETIGFEIAQVRPLHPHGDLKAALTDLPERTAYLLYGYQDYGLIARRPLKTTV